MEIRFPSLLILSWWKRSDLREEAKPNLHKAMRSDEVLLKLRMHEPMLRALGVEGISLFGSVAREAAESHDVDVAAKFSTAFSKGGLDYFGRLEEVEGRLSEILAGKVDLVEEPARKRRLQLEIDRDRAVAF